MARVIKPPAPLPADRTTPSVFLAGSIEMGVAEDWQARVERGLADLDVIILNPRRDEWDASWVQSIDNPPFREQVEWELAGLETATLVAMYFAPVTKAPVTLLELGLCARAGRIVVCCPEGYWRRGNVEVVCRRYGVTLLANLAEMVAEVRKRLALAGPRAALLCVADIEGPWQDPGVSSSLIERCERYWYVPIVELPNVALATFLRQKIALNVIVPEARKRVDAGFVDDTEMDEEELSNALRDASTG